MRGYQTRQVAIAVLGVADLFIRSLLDRQPFADLPGDAERLGISSTTWPLFGMLWPSTVHRAARLALRPVADGDVPIPPPQAMPGRLSGDLIF